MGLYFWCAQFKNDKIEGYFRSFEMASEYDKFESYYMYVPTKDMVRSYIWLRNETQPYGGFIWIFVYVLAA